MGKMIGAVALIIGFIIGWYLAERSQKCHG